jgi:hypothetical protein
MEKGFMCFIPPTQAALCHKPRQDEVPDPGGVEVVEALKSSFIVCSTDYE